MTDEEAKAMLDAARNEIGKAYIPGVGHSTNISTPIGVYALYFLYYEYGHASLDMTPEDWNRWLRL